jgi:hypothetical protein
MKRLAGTVLVAALSLPLAGCGGFGSWDFDPMDYMPGDIFNSKKKLEGERRPVFPEGVPGMARGIPQELIKGSEPPPSIDLAQGLEDGKADDPKPKAQPKARPKVVAKPPPAAEQSRPTPVTVRRTDQPAAQSQQQPANVQWPDPPPLRGQQQPQQEAPQQSRSQQPGQVQWPDPPPVNTFPR